MTDSITILPVSLALVHLPRSRLDSLTQHVLRQIIRPNPTFLNITCNEIELSLFAEHHALRDFERIAKQDSRKLRAIEKAERSCKKSSRRSLKRSWEPVEVSAERWSVLQIDSHSDKLENSGARVRELSAPLAAAGISILYQSSYLCDFIFVKSFWLKQVMTLLCSTGFSHHSFDPNNLTGVVSTFTSPLLTPATDDDEHTRLLELNPLSISSDQHVDAEGGAVFTRSRSATNSSSGSHSALNSQFLDMSTPSDFSDPSDGPVSHSENAEDVKTPALPSRPVTSRAQSHSPSGCEVSLLTLDLTYVGLSDDNADVWGLKIIKLVSFPELIVGSIAQTRTSTSSLQLFSAAPPGHRETAITAEEFVSTVDTQLQELSLNISAVSEGEGGTTSGSDTTTRVGPESPKDPELENVDSPVHDIHLDQLWHNDADNANSDTGNTSEEDSSFAAASPRRHYSNDFPAVNTLPHDYDSKRDRSYSEPTTGRPPLAHYDTFDTFTTVDTVRPSRTRDTSKSGSQSRSASASSATSSSAGTLSAPLLVPFFSFTRTPEGSSLTAPVSLLAALFPPDERDMVICRAELDVLDSREASPTADDEDVDEHEDEVDDDEPQGPLRCLQIDLRKFGLDKHGLVNRFSRTLEENGINHMYNSTYKTANLLVDKAHATRAQALLRSC